MRSPCGQEGGQAMREARQRSPAWSTDRQQHGDDCRQAGRHVLIGSEVPAGRPRKGRQAGMYAEGSLPSPPGRRCGTGRRFHPPGAPQQAQQAPPACRPARRSRPPRCRHHRRPRRCPLPAAAAPAACARWWCGCAPRGDGICCLHGWNASNVVAGTPLATLYSLRNRLQACIRLPSVQSVLLLPHGS